MKRISLFLCLLLVVTGTIAQAASTRNMCEKFFPNWNISQCIQQQESSAGNLNGWMNKPSGRFKNWAEDCRRQNLISYGVTSYVNYVGAEKCVRQLYSEYERNKTERMKAQKTYDRGYQKGYSDGNFDAETGQPSKW